MITTVIRLISVVWNTKIASGIATDLTSKAYLKIISQPYLYFVQNDSSKAISTLSVHSFNLFTLIRFTIQLLSSGFIIVCIISFLLSKSVGITLITLFILALYIHFLDLSLKQN